MPDKKNSLSMISSRIMLLRQTLAVLAQRNVSEANLPFVLSRIEIVRLLCNLLREQKEFEWLSLFINHINLINHKETCLFILSKLPSPFEPPGGFIRFGIHQQIVINEYERIGIIFSPEIGIGDELTFYQLLHRFQSEKCDLWSTLPEIWHNLGFPDAKNYCADPDAPFRCFSKYENKKTLIIHIGFLDGDFVKSAYRDYPESELMQITLGNHEIIYCIGGRLLQTYRPFVPQPNNYEFLFDISTKLFVFQDFNNAFYAVHKNKINGNNNHYNILVNPLTSKQMLISPESWAGLINICAGNRNSGITEVHVMGGFTDATQRLAYQIVDRLNVIRPEFKSDVLRDNEGNIPGIGSAINVVLEKMLNISLMLGIDTYTAHLAPLFGIPCFTIFYRNDGVFCVPGNDVLPLNLHLGLAELIRGLNSYLYLKKLYNPDSLTVKSRRYLQDIIKISQRIKSSLENNVIEKDNFDKDFLSLINAKEKIRSCFGAEHYEAITNTSGRPQIFDLYKKDDINLISNDDKRRLIYNWLASAVFTSLRNITENNYAKGCSVKGQ